jgi:two-component system nitrogen regulation response regulator GlnG
VLAEGEFFRVGGRELIRVDVRVIAATHQDLAAKVADGSFRADLLHRLDVVRLQLPPLRARKADIAGLAGRFLQQAAVALGTPAKRLRPDALRALEAHDWPGNVRELENLGWRLAALAHTGGHRQHAAERLGLGRNTLTRKLGATRTRKKTT